LAANAIIENKDREKQIMPSIKLDGREIPYQPGDTIIKAAHRAGIDIPHYCWHPGLSVAANCRMCLVEIAPPAGQRPLRLDVLRWDDTAKQYISEGKPKLQPSCQAACVDGMEVKSDSSSFVADARKAVQEFLLLNHPVDCPICDQAGECRLQDYWLEHGRYKKRMTDEILHKPKAVSFGPTIVYDAERCIVCTRCVRFVDEIAKDPVLEKRERGNLGEIFVAPGRQLDNNYTLMTEHVCPVGALTSKDFRFKARVWFLRTARSICQGCATGCNAYLDYDPRTMTAYRYRPRENEQVNQYWMCDVGMLSYRRAHEDRILEPQLNGHRITTTEALAHAKSLFSDVPPSQIALVLSAQHNSEDNFVLWRLAKEFLAVPRVYLTGRAHGPGDGILYHSDKNPNTSGVLRIAGGSLESFETLLRAVEQEQITHLLFLGSDAPVDISVVSKLKKAKSIVTITGHEGALSSIAELVLPAAVWAETAGTYVNAKGITQRSEQALRPHGASRPAWEWIALLAQAMGFDLSYKNVREVQRAMAPESSSASLRTSSLASTSPLTIFVDGHSHAIFHSVYR